jgi:hypothetical protein
MAVITAAVAAVAAAVATTTVATVATAVVAVSTAIGVTGLVVGGIGMAIGNEDLMFAGKIMGYVGMAGGLAGGLIGGIGAVATNSGLSFTQGFGDAFAGASQHLSEAWNNGVGGWLSGGDKVTGAIGGAADDVAAGAAKAPTSSPGNGMAAFPEVAESPTAVSTPIDTGSVSVGTQASSVQAPSLQAPGIAAPTVTAPVTQAVNAPSTISAMGNAGNWASTTPAAGGGLISSATEGLSNMPDWMKYSMMTTGAQGITGLAGGYFQGKSAEEQLELQKLQAQREENQRQLMNRQGNQVPSFRFNT